jgi:CRP-like cAMP-binding protein
MSEAALKNAILAGLPENVWNQMRPDFTRKMLQVPQILHKAGTPHSQVYFPLAGVISTVAVMEDGESVETATTGLEGMAPIGILLESETHLSQQLVQVSGEAMTISSEDFKKWYLGEQSFRDLLFRYSQAFLLQILQSVGCNAVHSTEERMARWLLTCHDRAQRDKFILTQQFLAEMLGVTRPMVNSIARSFHRSGFIDYTRGELSIKDRAGLESVACECYAEIRNAYRQRSL